MDAWHTGVAPVHAASESHPVRDALQSWGMPSRQRLSPTSHTAAMHWPLLQIGASVGHGVLPLNTPSRQVVKLVPSAHSVSVAP